MLRNNADARRCSYFELGLPVKERLQGDHCFLHFSRSDSERENSDWSELTNVNLRLHTFSRLVENNITPF